MERSTEVKKEMQEEGTQGREEEKTRKAVQGRHTVERWGSYDVFQVSKFKVHHK